MSDYVSRLEQQKQKLRDMLSSNRKGDSLDAMAKLFSQIQQTQRMLLLERGEETVTPIEWSPLWDICTPYPQAMASQNHLFLLYHAQCVGHEPAIAIVEFVDYESYRFCGFNSEMIENHPYRERGLEAYAAHTVTNSLWIRREQGINVVPPRHDDCSWEDYHHYFMTFTEHIFECLAKEHIITVIHGDMKDALRNVFSVFEKEMEENGK